MIGFGGYNRFPFTFGGGDSVHEIEHEAILGALDGALDPSEGTEHWCEAYAEAGLLDAIWAINNRLSNQMIPTRMMENLEVWEESTGLRPTPGTPPVIRRNKLAAKFRVMSGNSPADIEGMAGNISGTNFVEYRKVDPDNVISYWPGVNPGPPGMEWSSNYAKFAIVINQSGITESVFKDIVNELMLQLDRSVSSYTVFYVGISDPFIFNIGKLGRTLL